MLALSSFWFTIFSILKLFWGKNLAKKIGKIKPMNNQIMFFVGFSIFIIYAFFLARILNREKKQSYNPKLEVDVEDFDGIGNQGRIPDKKPKNRAT